MQKVWAVSAAGAYIRTVPVNSQIGVLDGAASFETGFVPDNFTNTAAGGVPPFGQDFNGLLNAMTAWEQWLQAGGPVSYDATFAAAIGGYPAGAVLVSAAVLGAEWVSLADNNMTNPDDPLTSVNWARSGLPVGAPIPLLTAATPPGYVLANGGGIGNTGSGATSSSPSFLFVYKAIWDQFSNTQCPIFDSAGNPSTRGANAVADFNALKRLVTPSMKGLGVIGCDTMGSTTPTTFLNGVPVTIGSTTTPGSILGENLHTLIAGEAPAVNSSGVNGITVASTRGDIALGNSPTTTGGGVFNLNAPTTFGAVSSTGNNTINVSTTNAGGGAHNNVERSMTVYWGLKT